MSKSYAWTDRKTGHLYARVRFPLGGGKYKTLYRRAESESEAAHLAKEAMLEFIFSEVRAGETDFTEFKERIKIYERFKKKSE